MKKVFVMCCVLLVASWAQGTLVGKWTFNEGSGTTALDSSGNGYNGTISGADYIATPGGTGLDFRGVDGGDQVIYDLGLNSQFPGQVWQWAIEGWVKMRSYAYGNPSTIMGQDGKKHGLVGGWKFGGYNDTLNLDVQQSGTTVMNQWYHVVVSYDGHANGNVGEYRLYINGALDATAAGDNYRANTSVPYQTGKNSDWTNEATHWLDGVVDEIRLYNEPLSAADVLADYQAGATVPEPATMSLLLAGFGLIAARKKRS